jgi:hypothetical protein
MNRQPVGLAGVVDRDHVEVIQARRQPRLAQEALAEALILRVALRQHLQRDRTPQPGIAREIDLTHPGAPDLGSDLVDAELSAVEGVSLAHGLIPSLARRPMPVPSLSDQALGGESAAGGRRKGAHRGRSSIKHTRAAKYLPTRACARDFDAPRSDTFPT